MARATLLSWLHSGGMPPPLPLDRDWPSIWLALPIVGEPITFFGAGRICDEPEPGLDLGGTVLLDLVWFEFVRHGLTVSGRLGPCEMDPFIVSGQAVLRMLSFLKRQWRFPQEALGHTSFTMKAEHYASTDSVENARVHRAASVLMPSAEMLVDLLSQMTTEARAELFRRFPN